MLSRQFVRSAQLRVTRRFTRNSIIQEINKADKIPVQKSNATIKDTDVIGKKQVYIQTNKINIFKINILFIYKLNAYILYNKRID